MLTSPQWLIMLPLYSLCIGCAAGAGQSREGRNRSHASDPIAVLTAAELSRDAQGETLLTALRRHRPQFLRSRGAAPMVTIDGSPLLEVSFLETLRVSAIAEVRLLRGPFALGYAGVSPDGQVVIGSVLYVRTRGTP